ncbi:MAG: hypothetical protein GY940_32565 [bacterium]|nr:hypothetical protein [bacterium]
MAEKRKIKKIMAFIIVALLVCLPGIASLYSQDTDPTKEDPKKDRGTQEEKKDKKKDKRDGKEGKVKEGKGDAPPKKMSVITDADLEKLRNPKKGKSDTAGMNLTKTTNQSAAANNKKSKEETVDPKKTEKYWRDRKADLEKQISDSEEAIKRMQEKLDQLQPKLLIQTDVLTDQLRIREAMTTLKDSIKNYKRGLETLRKKLEDLPDEARRYGVPPGWLR